MDGQFLHSAKWKRKRDSILRRDDYTCQLCKRYGKMKSAHSVHHIFPWEFYPEYIYENWNLISLCKDCHNRMHDRTSHAITEEGRRLQKKVWKNTKKVIPNSRDGSTV